MAFSVKCSGCGSALTVVEALIGKTIKCKTCGEPVTVSAPGGAAKPSMATPLDADVEAIPLDDDADEIIDAVPLDDDEPAPPKRPAEREPRRPMKPNSERLGRMLGVEPVRKKSSLPLILGGLVGLVALGGIGAGAAYFMNRDDGTAGMPPTFPSQTVPQPTITNPVVTPPTKREPVVDPKPATNPPKATPPVTTPPVTSGTDEDDNPFNPKGKKPTPEPVKPTPTTPPVETPKVQPTIPAVSAPPTKIDAATLAKLKASTVYLEVDDGRGGGGTGTGWFTGEPGLIVTNAHVLQMKLPGSKEPAKISVFVESGQAKQRLFEGPKVKVLGVDHEKDLAVIQIVNEKDLPPPLPVKPSASLNELDRLVVLGFPGGRRMAERNGNTNPPVVSVTESTVSAFQNDNFGNRNSIQVQGGINHGSSGGPVVDADGSVVGVAVRVDLNHNGQLTSIAEAVPSEYVTGLIAGRAGRVELGQAYLSGDRVKVPVSVRCSDPLGQLKTVGIGYWIAEKNGRPRAPGDARQPQSGDVSYAEATLTYVKEKQAATGEIDFPQQLDGRAYWVQPFFTNKLVAKRYVAGNPVALTSPPVERAPADLRPKYATGAKRELKFVQKVEVTEVFQATNGEETRLPRSLTQEITAEETVSKAKTAVNFASLDYTFTSLAAKLQENGADKELPKPVAAAVAGSKPTTVALAINRTGEVTAATTSPATGIDPTKKEALARYGRQLSNTLRDGLLKLPGKSTNAGETWTVTRTHWLMLDADDLFGERTGDTKRQNQQTQEELTVTYLGRRTRGGRAEAVLSVTGTIRPGDAAPDAAVSGTVKGTLILEDQTGAITEAEFTRTFDLDTDGDGPRKRVTGTESVTITRGK